MVQSRHTLSKGAIQRMIDAHLHLHRYNDLDTRIPAWQAAGIQGVVAVSDDLASSYRTLELKTNYPDFIYVAIGFHPEQQMPTRSEVDEWRRLVRAERALLSCIGEIGLPHYEAANLPQPLESYQERLAEFLTTAEQEQLPVALHAVHNKAELVYDSLQTYAPNTPAHFHWLKAPRPALEKITAAGYMVSVTPEACYRERDQRLAAQVPMKQLLVETDGPWPFNGPFSNKETTPLLLIPLIEKIAEVKGVALADASHQLQVNAVQFYGG
ncbi:TatD family hydrolase [Salsuginibacillus kocurii]|uniref:TatD family hydrolase n=1 Tax=Salsuginibacillus kocurii TaxID=427078 RepID=UPI001F0A48DC|nr:TatD family hydrolase [Salsuginibacillus kocurii]